MSIKIPLNLQRPAVTAGEAAAPGLRVSLPIGLPGVTPTGPAAGRRETQVLRAVTAAAAALQPGEALRLARLGEHEPWKLLGEFDSDAKKAALGAVLEAVVKAVDDGASVAVSDEHHRAVASAIGASATLTAVARDALEARPDAMKPALGWAGWLDRVSLEKAGRAAVTAELALIPDLETRLDRIEDAVAGLDQRVAALEQQGGGGTPSGGAAAKKTARD